MSWYLFTQQEKPSKTCTKTIFRTKQILRMQSWRVGGTPFQSGCGDYPHPVLTGDTLRSPPLTPYSRLGVSSIIRMGGTPIGKDGGTPQSRRMGYSTIRKDGGNPFCDLDGVPPLNGGQSENITFRYPSDAGGNNLRYNLQYLNPTSKDIIWHFSGALQSCIWPDSLGERMSSKDMYSRSFSTSLIWKL